MDRVWGGGVRAAFVFHRKLDDPFGSLSSETAGVLLIVAAAFTWSIYGLIQKRLLRVYAPATTILMFYLVGVLLYLPFASPLRLLSCTPQEFLLLGVCGLTSLVSYVAFAEALNHWEASRVSVEAGHPLWPEVVSPESLGLAGIAGALFVVAGSMLSSLLRASSKRI